MANRFTIVASVNEYPTKFSKRVYTPILVWGAIGFITLLGNSVFLPEIVNIISVIALIVNFICVIPLVYIIKKRRKKLSEIQSKFISKEITLVVEDKKIYLFEVDSKNVLNVDLDDKTGVIDLHRSNKEVTTHIKVDVVESARLKADLESAGIEVLSIEELAYREMNDPNRVRSFF